jgi:hypothetical protein
VPAYLTIHLVPVPERRHWPVLEWGYFPPELCARPQPPELGVMMMTEGNPEFPHLPRDLYAAGVAGAQACTGKAFSDLGLIPQVTAVRLTRDVSRYSITEPGGGYWDRLRGLGGCEFSPDHRFGDRGWGMTVTPLMQLVAANFEQSVAPRNSRTRLSCILAVHCKLVDELL